VDGGMLWRNGCDGKVLRCGAGNRHQHVELYFVLPVYGSTSTVDRRALRYIIIVPYSRSPLRAKGYPKQEIRNPGQK
jgi:hypothetical protein